MKTVQVTVTQTVFQFNVYSATVDGDVSADPIRIEELPFATPAQATSHARKLARKEQAPIDLAYAGGDRSDWSDRYIGTASPRYPHTDCKVTEFERLD